MVDGPHASNIPPEIHPSFVLKPVFALIGALPMTNPPQTTPPLCHSDWGPLPLELTPMAVYRATTASLGEMCWAAHESDELVVDHAYVQSLVSDVMAQCDDLLHAWGG